MTRKKQGAVIFTSIREKILMMNRTQQLSVAISCALMTGIAMISAFQTNIAAVPYQLPSTSNSATDATTRQRRAITITLMPEEELDNPSIKVDDAIYPARKCAVCIGVSVVKLYHNSVIEMIISPTLTISVRSPQSVCFAITLLQSQ